MSGIDDEEIKSQETEEGDVFFFFGNALMLQQVGPIRRRRNSGDLESSVII